MAKEADLKKIELKVFVDCCDGCKKKVKKVLRSVEGVLKVEIDPLHPKVVVLGSVDAQLLIKKLLKAGKQAEIWSTSGNHNSKQETKEVKASDLSESNTQSHSDIRKCQKPSQPTATDENTGMDKAHKDLEKGGSAASVASNIPRPAKNASSPESHSYGDVSYTIYPSSVDDSSELKPYAKKIYLVEPCTITLPSYAICSYMSSLPPLEERYPGMPIFQSPAQFQVTEAGDYFSDENTIGCHIM